MWDTARRCAGAGPDHPFVYSVNRHTAGRRLNRHVIRRRFRTACKFLDAADHANVLTTSAYLHVAVDDDDAPGDLFGFK